MIDWSKFLKEKKEKTFLVLDIGSESVKALIFKTDNGRIFILKSVLEYFDELGSGNEVFESGDLEKAVFQKTVLRALSQVLAQIDEKPKVLFWSLPADIFKERITRQDFIRKNPRESVQEKEKNEICREIFDASSKEIQKEGFLLRDLHFAVQKILEIKIDGYDVSEIENYRGRNASFKILSAFSPSFYFKEIENIFQKLHFLKNKKIVSLSEAVISFAKEKPEGFFFINIGGKVTQIFLTKDGRIEKIGEFKAGGAIFSGALSEKLGLRMQEGRILKERYGKGELSQESTEKMKEIFSFPCQVWFSNLKLKIREMTESKLLPPKIGIFGGGSLLPEIKEVLEKGNWDDFSFAGEREIKSISLGDFKNIEDLTKKSNDSRFTPSLFIALSAKPV